MEDLDFSSKSTILDILNKRALPLENHGAHRELKELCTEYDDHTEMQRVSSQIEKEWA